MDGYGGVFLACSTFYNWDSLPLDNADNNVEAVACKLQLKNNMLIIMAIYRPPNSDFTYLQSMCQLIQGVVFNYPNATIWVGGDLNLPNIDWSTNSPSGNNYPLSFCNIVLDLFSEVNFTQLVNFPTRESNTLDIFATNRPTLINKCIPVPGISDHDAVYVESQIKARYKKSVKRKLYLWEKTDFNLLTQVLSEFVSDFNAANTTSSSIQQMWDDFKTKCIDCLELVPYKYSSTKYSQPWVTSNTKRICRKKKRLYNKARSSGSAADWTNYKEVKKAAQRQCRNAYFSYVSQLFDSRSNRKKFWSFIKGRQKIVLGFHHFLLVVTISLMIKIRPML